MISQQLGDLRQYFDTLNVPQKKEFISKLKVKVEQEKNVSTKNSLIKLLNYCTLDYNNSLLKKQSGRK